MKPGAPETVEAIRAARVVHGLARWAWERRPEVFSLEFGAGFTYAGPESLIVRHGELNDEMRGNRAVIVETGSAVVRESEYGHD